VNNPWDTHKLLTKLITYKIVDRIVDIVEKIRIKGS